MRHRLLSLEGPAILVATVLLWVLLLWSGWAALFSASESALVDSRTRTPANAVERIYFTGYTLFTLGNGDFTPEGGPWQLATATASLSGFALVTLMVTYLLSVLGAVTSKRSFASQVFALGPSAEEFVTNAWDGRAFGALELQLMSLVEQLNLVTEKHRAYPMLHFYHAEQEQSSVPAAVVVLDDALTLLRYGVREEQRPARVALHCAREAVRGFLETLSTSHISPAAVTPGFPVLGRLRDAGIPVHGEEDFSAAAATLAERRRLLRGLLDSDAREWPPHIG